MPKPRGVRDAEDQAIDGKEGLLGRVTQRVGEHVARLKEQIVAGLSGLSLSALQRQVSRLIQELGRQSGEFERRATREIAAESQAAVTSGQTLVDAPLVSAGIEIIAPDVTLPLLQTVLDFSADRLKGLSAEVVSQIAAEMRLGALGVKTPYEVIQAVADKLRVGGAGTGTAGSLAARAETIVRTELGRIHSMSAYRRLEQALETMPDLMKEWRHSGNLINPRDGHRAISGTRIPVREFFWVAPTVGGTKERMLYPHDPAASARNTVRCRCTALPYLARWEE